MAEKISPIALQSKEWIVESFFDLLSIKPINIITISEIAENAGLDRRTVYRHFAAKVDIIEYYFKEVSNKYEEKLKEKIKAESNSLPREFSVVRAFFEMCEENKEVLIILYEQNLLHLLLGIFNNLFPALHYRFSTEEELKFENQDYFLAYNIGGLWNLLVKWIEKRCIKTPEQMEEIVDQLFSNKII